jgi:hypothetical protein
MDWLRDSFSWLGTAAFLAVAGYCVARLVAAARTPETYRGCHRVVDVAHVLMALGMATMLSPVGGPLPMAAWQTVFLLMTAYFTGSWWRSRGTAGDGWHGGWHGNGLHHALAAAAMLYMLTAMPHSGHTGAPWLAGGLDGMTGMAGMALPAVGWVLAAYFLAWAAVLVRWRSPAGPSGLPALLTAPAAMTACQTTMAAGTGAMLVAMLA